MIVSALLTSVGINLGLCVLFIVIYSILRNQPGNVKVYAPRSIVEGKAEHDDDIRLERFRPSPRWLMSAWSPSEDELLAIAGLDAVVFMRIFILCFKVFVIAGIIGMFVLVPVNYRGDQIEQFDLFNITNQSLDKFSISNVKDGSKWLWIHFTAAYVITAVVCYLLYSEYSYISSKRLEYFDRSDRNPHDFTILVRGIPKYDGRSFSASVKMFFTELHPSLYMDHLVVHRTNKLQALMNGAEDMYKKIVHFKSRGRSPERSVSSYDKISEDLEEKVWLDQTGISMSGEEVSAAFVCFRSRYAMANAIHIRQSIDPTYWVTEQAPEPCDVYWPYFSTTFMGRWISKFLVFLACVLLTIFFLIPVTFVQGLAHLEQLNALLPFLQNILSIPFVSQVITGYLPSLILHTFLSTVPPVMKLVSTMEGYISNSQIERSACTKMIWFTTWNIFFANVLSGTIATQWKVIVEPRKVPILLANVVPAQATFFISYVVTSGWTNLSSELTRTSSLICDFLGRNCFRCILKEFSAPSVPYHRAIPSILFFGLIGITYFLLAPLILPFILVYFCLGYVIYRNQLLNVYCKKYETGGRFWPSVHNTMIFSLLLMQAIAIGIFTVKKLQLANLLTFPLLIVTYIFNEYCQKRFLPIFKAYSAESLIKKDRREQNDPAMEIFFDNLMSDYRKYMMAEHCSDNPDSQSTPLLSDHT